VHGEEKSARGLGERLNTNLGWRTAIPAFGETVTF
jgi:hypothetical protein